MDDFDRGQEHQLDGYDEALEVVNSMARDLRCQVVGARHGVNPEVERAYTAARAVIEAMETHRTRVYGEPSGITDHTDDEIRLAAAADEPAVKLLLRREGS